MVSSCAFGSFSLFGGPLRIIVGQSHSNSVLFLKLSDIFNPFYRRNEYSLSEELTDINPELVSAWRLSNFESQRRFNCHSILKGTNGHPSPLYCDIISKEKR